MQAVSPIDAFFVAYEESADITMSLGVEVELSVEIEPIELEAVFADMLPRYPELGSRLVVSALGPPLKWNKHHVSTEGMVHSRVEMDLDTWRNTRIDPFAEPPFQVLVKGRILGFKAHHVVADGEAFDAVVREALERLASRMSGGVQELLGATQNAANRPWGWVWGPRALYRMWRYMRRQNGESRLERGARLVLNETQPGPLGSLRRRCDRQRMAVRAEAAGVRPSWWAMASWLKALHAFNVERGRAEPHLVSLEVPVSLRRAQGVSAIQMGNRVSALLLLADGRAETAQVAQHLRAQLVAAVRRGEPYAVPLFSAPGRLLPWSVFRRIAVSPSSTGFATSHFAWFEPKHNTHARIKAMSGGRLEVLSERIVTPVCLKMGVALSILVDPDALWPCWSYRKNALDQAHMERLAELFLRFCEG